MRVCVGCTERNEASGDDMVDQVSDGEIFVHSSAYHVRYEAILTRQGVLLRIEIRIEMRNS